ncbi:MAG: serine--tRNA ligase [Cellvibrionales bacterium]|nr:serine--tRNA ligase [Cellvibrionales bacterium]
MLDIKLLRNDVDTIANALQKRGFTFDVDQFNQLESMRKASDIKTQQLQSDRKKASKKVGELIQSGKTVDEAKAEVSQLIGTISQALDQEVTKNKAINDELLQFLSGIPNIPDADVPEGKDESDNKVVSLVGEPKGFDFEIKDHVDLGATLDGMDFDTGVKLSGSRFVVLKEGIARLHRALAQFMLDTHAVDHGYSEVNVPVIVNSDTLKGTGQLPKFEEDLFKIEHDNRPFYLIPTAEAPITNLYRDEIVTDLPKKFVAHTPCFRSEAGSYGRDVRGMIRQHQFEKVELVQIVSASESDKALEELTSHAENILKALELPYRKVLLCTGDMGFSAAKTYDLEVWLPSQNTYREISSCSNTRDFQARRMQTREKIDGKQTAFVHTLNGSGLAVGRTLIAVMENYQQADGSIAVPDCLVPYMRGQKVIA